jgi:hypothetical protein
MEVTLKQIGHVIAIEYGVTTCIRGKLSQIIVISVRGDSITDRKHGIIGCYCAIRIFRPKFSGPLPERLALVCVHICVKHGITYAIGIIV